MAATDPFEPEIVYSESARVACDGATAISPALRRLATRAAMSG